MFSPSRLTLARKKRGLTKKALAELLEITPQSIINFESETIKEEPGVNTLTKISQVLDFPIDFFAKDAINFLPMESASFRAMSKMTAMQRDSSFAAGLLAFELNDWIEQRFTLPNHSLPDFRNETPETAATLIRQMWLLGEKPIPNMIHLLEAHGIRVYSIAEDYKNVDAFSIWNNGVPFVLLNTQKSSERSRFDAAHELGHLVLHKHGVPRSKQSEQEANAFASAFLMPENTIFSQAPKLPIFKKLIEIKHFWKVSLSALVYRLNSLGLISEWQHRNLVIDINKNGYNTNEPFSIPKESSQILLKVFNALKTKNIKKNDVAKEIGISLKELEKLTFGMIEIDGGNNGKREQSSADLHIVK